MFFSVRGSWANILRKFGRTDEAVAYEAEVEIVKREFESVKTHILGNKKDKFARAREKKDNIGTEDYEIFKQSRKQLTKKDFLASAIILLVGMIIFSVFYYINANQVKKASNPNYVMTTATAEMVKVEDSDRTVLRFVFRVYDEETDSEKAYVFSKGTSISGVNYIEGKSIDVYYSKHNPEIAWHKIDSNFLMSLAILGLCFGVAFAVLNLILTRNNALSFGMGSVFFLFCYGLNFYIAQSAGFSFVELLFSGVAVYAMNLFGLIGLLFILLGVFSLIKTLRLLSYGRKINNYEKYEKWWKKFLQKIW